MTPKERFLSKILPPDINGCWNWGGSFVANGYGQFFMTARGVEKNVKANRAAWFFHSGSFPKEFVLHKCHNRKCVNPDHLYLGDHAQNMRDMVESGRVSKGAHRHNFILSDKKVEQVKVMRGLGMKVKDIRLLTSLSTTSVMRAIHFPPAGPFINSGWGRQ